MISNIIREIKLHKLLDEFHPILSEFINIWNDLSIINVDVYNKDGWEFIYYNSKNEWIFYQDLKNDQFWCEYNRYWLFLESKFQIDHNEIQAITKYLVEDSLKNKIGASRFLEGTLVNKVEDALKNKVGTSIECRGNISSKVEDALKNKVGTSGNIIKANGRAIADVMKNKFETSNVSVFSGRFKIEDSLKNILT